MQLYSTKNHHELVGLDVAVMKGLPDDNGLFMPKEIPTLPDSFIKNLHQHSFQSIAYEVSKALIQGFIPDKDLKKLVENAINFPAPVVKLDDQKYILELFHGPSLAFKDFGARFMAQLMSYFNRRKKKKLVILVATSGDTGGAVAAGFYKTLGIEIVILYPSGKVSMLQEKQLTTLGENVRAIEVNGTFDDCQALVKQAFLDKDLNKNIRLSSANSINIARLIPQSFYYFEAFKQIDNPKNEDIVFCIPSGNFGNLTAGLFAQRMGLPIKHFIAATNANDVVPEYLETNMYTPRPSVRTLSNAMDVGNPSNFARMLDLYSSTWNIMKNDISGFAISDKATEKTMIEVYNQYKYILDPHGAVGYLALEEYQKKYPKSKGVVLETAHPSKFIDDVERILNLKIEIPQRLAELADRKKEAVYMNPDFEKLKVWLIDTF